MDCSPPGSSIHGILQARVLESGVIAFSVFFLFFFFSKMFAKKKLKWISSGHGYLLYALQTNLHAVIMYFHEETYTRNWYNGNWKENL